MGTVPAFVVLLSAAVACAATAAGCAPHTDGLLADDASSRGGDDTVNAVLRPWPTARGPFLVAVRAKGAEVVTAYDNALVALVLLRRGRRADAGRVLSALERLQRPDGSVPFSFTLPQPDVATPYVRAGAAAWVGYAAVAYLDSEAGGEARERVLTLAHRVAFYLLTLQVRSANDRRDGLVTGGEGSFRYDVDRGKLRETYVPGVVPFASTEHNIDAYFFFKSLGRISGDPRYREAAERISAALTTRGWNATTGQLRQGITDAGTDDEMALDCASWGSLFLRSAGDVLRAETSYAVADGRYASQEPVGRVPGHKPYAHRAVYENRSVAEFFKRQVPSNTWNELEAIWPEGSAGVALAAWRAGYPQRARAILDALEELRPRFHGLPALSREVPLEFDTKPSVAGAAWVELVRWEMGRSPERQALWSER